ncbi:MAG: helix-turn-helix domain-containing protein [Rhodoferax sp.]|uniref:helix-turn-helix domain-containing protein n=1 Tax=Rhodoferax sp. TaxID=50421 RepID=UPI002734F1F5|nr:helix-turn-helix domain-containing protein [Rhodoferax sp.]MDP2677331.1 helix-turn-helix domain-containing protein [Rhodoferax sp.]
METLTIEEAAEFLKIHPVTLSEKAALGEIPGARIGKRWVFIKVDLIDFIRSQYRRQAMQGEPMEITICHSTKEKTPRFGGSRSRLPTDDAYNKALGLPTK